MPHIASGVGAVATQALVNPFYGVDGLRLLRDGHAAARRRRSADRGRCRAASTASSTSWTRPAASPRIPARTASTGADIVAGEGFSVAGNMLAGPARDRRDREGLRGATRALPFPRRLIAAMEAGEAAGGDKRGKQSAALLIYGEEE